MKVKILKVYDLEPDATEGPNPPAEIKRKFTKNKYRVKVQLIHFLPPVWPFLSNRGDEIKEFVSEYMSSVHVGRWTIENRPQRNWYDENLKLYEHHTSLACKINSQLNLWHVDHKHRVKNEKIQSLFGKEGTQIK